MWLYKLSLNYYGLWLIGPLALLLCAYLTAMVAIVQLKKDTSIANFVWGGGCLLIAWYLYFLAPLIEKSMIGISKRGFLLHPFLNRSLVMMVLITIWAGRLIMYVYLRYRGDDPRYQTWKQAGTRALIINIGYIFILQTLLMVIMAVPIFVVIAPVGTSLFTYLDFIGLGIWLVGYYFEAISDAQLYTFTRNPANKGKVMRYGLWRYSRHPNYFGEILMWWGIFLIALNVSAFAIVAPITITFLLLFVTGIPWVEKAMEKNPEYQEYKKHTSIFIPWFPK